MSNNKMPWPDLAAYNLTVTVMHDKSGNRALVVRPSNAEEAPEKSKARAEAMEPKLKQVCQKLGEGQLNVTVARDRFLVFTGPMIRNQGMINRFFGKLFPKSGTLELTLEEAESAEVVSQAAKARFSTPLEGPDTPFHIGNLNEALPAGVVVSQEGDVWQIHVSGEGKPITLNGGEDQTNQDAVAQIQDALNLWYKNLDVDDDELIEEHLITLNKELNKDDLSFWQQVIHKTERDYYSRAQDNSALLAELDDLESMSEDALNQALGNLNSVIGSQGRMVRKALVDKHSEVQSRLEVLEGLGVGEPEEDNVQQSEGGKESEGTRYEEVGKNVEGYPVVENKRGVRGYIMGDLISWEPVALIPTANGYAPEAGGSERNSEYLTVEETLDREDTTLPLGDLLRAAFEVHDDGRKGWHAVALNHEDESHRYLMRSRFPGEKQPALEMARLQRSATGTMMAYTSRLTSLNEHEPSGLPYPAPAAMYKEWVAAGFDPEQQEITVVQGDAATDSATIDAIPESEGTTDDDTASARPGGTVATDEYGQGTVPDATGRPDGASERTTTDAGSSEPTDGSVLEQREQSGAAGPGEIGGDNTQLERPEGGTDTTEPVSGAGVDADGTARDGAGGRGSLGERDSEGAELSGTEQAVSGEQGTDGDGGALSGRDEQRDGNGVQSDDSRDLFGADGAEPEQADGADAEAGVSGSDQPNATAGNSVNDGVHAGGGTGEPEREPGSETNSAGDRELSGADRPEQRDSGGGQGDDQQSDWESLGDNLTDQDFAGPERFVADANEPPRGPAQRLKDNLQALTLLNELNGSSAEPTLEDRAELARFSGFGGIHPDLFAAYHWNLPEWAKSGNIALREMSDSGVISKEDFRSLRSTVLNAHYSHAGVIEPMWEALDKLGIPLDRTLEPSSGTLNFKAYMPESAANKVKSFTAIEYDKLTARLAQAVHPDAQVIQSGFEKTSFPDSFFDCAISNIPFGDYSVFDPEHPNRKQSIHNQFFLKGLDKVRPGGVVAFLTSSYVLDSTNTDVRKEMMNRSHVIGTYRLPTGTFSKTTGTDVMTDIIFLQKKGNFTPSYTPLDIEATTTIEAPLAASSSVEFAGEVYEPGEMIPNQKINKVYADHPERILGDVGVVTSQFGPTLKVTGGGTITEQRDVLRQAFESMPGDITDDERQTLTPEQISDAIEDKSRNALKIDELPGALSFDGTVFWAKERQMGGSIEDRKITVPKRSTARMAASIKAMESLSDLMVAEATAKTPEEEDRMEALRQTARTDAEALLKLSNGKKPLTGASKAILDADGRSSYLRGAIDISKENQWALADIYSRRTINPITDAPTKADTLEDALAVSLAYTAKISESYMATLLADSETPLTAQEIRDALIANQKAFIDPANNDLVEQAEYLSGNLKPKLEVARNVAASDSSFQGNIEALEKAMPDPLKPSEIKVSMDAFWLPTDILEDFFTDGLGITTTGNYGVKPYFDTHKRHWRSEAATSRGAPSIRSIARHQEHVAHSRWGTTRKSVFDLLDYAFTNTTPKVMDPIPGTEPTKYQVNTEETLKAQAKYDELTDQFKRWVYKSPERAQRLADIYNQEINTWVLHDPDGSHMVYPGMAEGWVPRKHQNDFIWRAVSGKNCMTAHAVGAGKTMQLIGSAIRGKQMGRWNKPLTVVPNHMLEQFANDALEIYPGARILVMTAADARAENRPAFAARCAMGEWDLVICTHSVFEKITVPNEFVAEMVTNEIEKLRASMEGDDQKDYKQKEIEKAIKTLETRLERALKDINDGRENALNMSQIGIDWVGVDEAHYFKNLMVDTAQQIPGVSNASSQRATNMLLKTQYLNSIHDGPYGVMMATGTPVSNSVVECYTFQRYLRPDLLESMGIYNFNDWMGLFGEVKHGMEIKPEGGGYQMKSRLSRFKNIPELVKMVRTFIDFKTREDLKLPTPNVTSETVVAPQSPFMKNFMKYIEARARDVRAGRDGGNSSAERIATEIRQRLNKANDKTVIDKETGEVNDDLILDVAKDILLTIATDGRKASLDPRLIHPKFDDFEKSKSNLLVEKCINIYHKHDADKAAQMIFCDFSSPTGKGVFNLYDDIKQKLIKAGIPEEEIAFIHNAKSDSDKEKLFSDIRSGDVRFILGSTQKMGVGTNVQERLVAMHELDPPWKPADIEQRLGRMDRQGNLFDEVSSFTYVSEDSFDLFMWEALNRKLRMTRQAMRHPEDCARDIDEEVEVGYEEILAVTTGNPAIRDYMETRQAMDKLKRMHSSYIDQQADLAQQIHNQEAKVRNIEGYLEGKIEEQTLVNSKLPLHIEFDGPQPGLRDGSACTAGGLDGLADAVKNIADRVPAYRTITVGKIGGLELVASRMSDEPRISIVRHTGQKDQIHAFINQDDLLKDSEKYNSDGSLNKNLDDYRTAAKSLARFVHRIATDNGISGTEQAVAENRRNLENMKADLGAPFEYEQELEDTHKRFEELSALLGDEIDNDKPMDPTPLVELATQIAEQTQEHGDLPDMAYGMATAQDIREHFPAPHSEDDLSDALNDSYDDTLSIG